MKKNILFSLLLISLVASIMILTNVISRGQEVKRISEILNCSPDKTSIHQALMKRFEIGMTRNEVYTQIIKLDPLLENHLGENGYLGNDSFICYNHLENNQCSEFIHFFSNSFSNRFGIGFFYQDDILINFSLLSF